MNRLLCWGAILAAIVIFADKSYSLDITTMADQSSLRCWGGVVAIGDSERDVQEKCGGPLEVAYRQDFGPIWIYHLGQQDRFMYYLAFLHGKLQRIASAPCNPNEYECFDLR